MGACCAVIDLFDDGSLDPEVRDYAAKKERERKGTTIDPQELLEEAERVVNVRRTIHVSLTGKPAKYEVTECDPVGVAKLLDIKLNRQYDIDRKGTNPASNGQLWMLKKLGVEAPESLSKWGASKLISKLKKREANGVASLPPKPPTTFPPSKPATQNSSKGAFSMSNSIVQVPFYGDTLEAIKTEDGKILVHFKRVCESLGVHHTRQLTKLRQFEWCELVDVCTVAQDVRQRQLTMIDHESLPMWLATINVLLVRQSYRMKTGKYLPITSNIPVRKCKLARLSSPQELIEKER
jgi:hypothetical protein